MANALRGEASIEADGETLTLRLDFNTFCSIEDATGLGIEQLGPALAEKPSAKLLRSVFWACLQKHHPAFDMERAGDVLSGLGQDGIQDALARLFQAVMPKPDPQSPAPRSATRGGTGKR